jgi:hypothetical protein
MKTLAEMSAEFLTLRDTTRRLEQPSGDQSEWSSEHEDGRERQLELLCARMSVLTEDIATTTARNAKELLHKARVALDWINPEGDLADRIVASVCGDVVDLFSEDADNIRDEDIRLAN